MHPFKKMIFSLVFSTEASTVAPTSFSFDGGCGTGTPTRTKFGSNSDLSDGCSFSLVVTGGSITLEASSSLNSGTSLNTSFSISGFGSSSILNNIPGSVLYGSIITLPPGNYTGTFGYAFSLSQGTASVRITT